MHINKQPKEMKEWQKSEEDYQAEAENIKILQAPLREDFFRKAGIPSRMLAYFCQKGQIDKVSRGGCIKSRTFISIRHSNGKIWQYPL